MWPCFAGPQGAGMGQMGGMAPVSAPAEGNCVPAAFRKKGPAADTPQSTFLPPGLAALEANATPSSPMMPMMPGNPAMGIGAMGSTFNPAMGMPGNPAMGMPGNPAMGIPGNPAMGMPGSPAMGMSGNPAMGMPGSSPMMPMMPGLGGGLAPGFVGSGQELAAQSGAFWDPNGGLSPGANFPVGANLPVAMYGNQAMSQSPTSGVMQTMMEQQVQFQQMLMDEELMKQMHEQKQQQEQRPQVQNRPRKDLPMPPPLMARPDYVKMLHEFMDKYDFDDRHKLRLIAAIGNRVDMFVEDIETLSMIMQAGSNPKNPGAFLVSCVKRMEDGTFQHRDPATRAAWRRKQEGNKEEEDEDDEKMPTADVKKLIRTTGSIRAAHLAQQKRNAAEMAKNKEKEDNNSNNRSRSRGRGNRKRSRSNSRRRRH